jgi:hypothetical protein
MPAMVERLVKPDMCFPPRALRIPGKTRRWTYGSPVDRTDSPKDSRYPNGAVYLLNQLE